MRKIIKIIEKNFRGLTRTRKSAIVIFLAPLFLVGLLGLAFSNTSSFSLRVGIYADNYTDLSSGLIQKMNDNQVSTIKYSSEEECVDNLKDGTNQICLILPSEFAIGPNCSNDIIFYVDYSKVSLIYVVLDMIGDKIGAQESEISRDLTSELLEKLSFTQESLKKDKEILKNIENNNNLVKQKNDKFTADFQSIDVGFNKDEFDINRLQQRIDTVKKLGLDAVQEAKSLVDKTSLNQTQKDDQEAELDKIKSDIEQMFNITGADEMTLRNKIPGILSQFSAKLDATKAKMDMISRYRTDLSAGLADVKTKLDETQGYINDLKASFTDIDARISGIAVRNATQIVNPINTIIKPVSTGKSHFSNILPTLLVLIVVITGILLSSTMVMGEKKGQAYVRNYLTPTRPLLFNIGTFITNFILLMIQLTIFLTIAIFSFRIHVMNVLWTFGALVLIIGVFILIGMLLGLVFQSQETNTLASIILASFFIFFSNTVLPLESMPGWMISLAQYNPFVVSETLLKQSMLFADASVSIFANFLLMLIYFTMLFLLMLIVQDYLSRIAFFHKHVDPAKKMGKIGF
ncbi:ABC transporter permease [Candidatus Woesearchaeota archaeon]|nr:ABC transporter permease [Candidatus Woesearchaeota archaeon]